MTLEELGAALRQEREKRGLLIDDVADHLKISTRLLRALEEGDRESLPHQAYTRGFVRSYAAYLGMAADEVSAALLAMSGEREEEPAPMYVRPRRRKGGSGKWLFILLLLLGLAGLGYIAHSHGWLDKFLPRSPRLAQPAPPLPGADTVAPAQVDASPATTPVPDRGKRETPAAPGANMAAGGPPTSPTALQTNRPTNQATDRPAGQTQAGTQAAGTADSRPEKRPSAMPGQSEAPANAATKPAASPTDGTLPAGQHRVVITAVEECWIHSNADNTDTRQFSLNKGDTFALTFTRNLRIKLGNAGGVRIRYNGQEMPAAGTSGQVRTLTFPPATH